MSLLVITSMRQETGLEGDLFPQRRVFLPCASYLSVRLRLYRESANGT
jgi:hypothetical protein